MINNQQSMLMR